MAKRISDATRESVLRMLAQREDRETIAALLGITPNQVSAIAAHVTMGTYDLPQPTEHENFDFLSSSLAGDSTSIRANRGTRKAGRGVRPILLGADAKTGEEVNWNPNPETGSANPHMLVIGESGFGKTYTICCLIGELAQQGVVSIVIDYGQGFLRNSLPSEFVAAVDPVEILASSEGININPLQIFPMDLLGPVNVAQRLADTFARVYPRIGVQQHSALRRAVLELFNEKGIIVENTATWKNDPPAFSQLQLKLESLANNSTAPYGRYAASALSHVSTIFVFNTFRPNGHKMSWRELIRSKGGVFVIQLKGLEGSLESAVTEFLLWNLIGYIETLGPSPLRCFLVLDEAHKLSFGLGSPVEKLLREGRKFGVGLILASQQSEDFSPVAFANTATKIVFQVADDRNVVSRQLHRKLRKSHSFSDVHEVITKLPRGCSYVVSENVGKPVKITSMQVRAKRWELRRR
jgi:hypothetical protein